ncbi:MAG: hypothetical protein K2J16_01695, partial [Clostridia bacterium]|nr:hypothetical protein [Clostridia bacterium]
MANQIGGAIFMSCSNDARSISIEGGEISGNTAGKTQSIVYVDRGILLIVGGDSAAQLSGEICIHQGTATVGTAAPDFSNVIFRTTTIALGKLVFRTNGDLTLDEDYVKGIKVDSADAYLGEDSKSVYTKPWPIVTLNVNGANVTHYASPNGTALPDTIEGLEDSKYISGWEFNGTTYSSGDIVKIGEGDSLKAILRDKFKVTVHLNDENTRVYYVKPNDRLVIGSGFAPHGKVFSHWESNGSTYKEGDAVLITADTVITAIFNDDNATLNKKGNSLSKAAVIAIVVVVLLVVIGVTVTVLVVAMRKKANKNSKKKSAEKSSDDTKATAAPAQDVKPTVVNTVPTAQSAKSVSTATPKTAQSAKTTSDTAKTAQSAKATTSAAKTAQGTKATASGTAKSAQSAKSTAGTAKTAKPVAKTETKTGTKSAEKKPTAKK